LQILAVTTLGFLGDYIADLCRAASSHYYTNLYCCFCELGGRKATIVC